MRNFTYRLLYMGAGAAGILAVALTVADKPSVGVTLTSLSCFVFAYMIEGRR